MKRKLTFNIAFSGIICAICIITMYLSLIPYFTYLVPALAGLFIWIISDQLGTKWGLISYVGVSFLSFVIVPQFEANIFFVLFFGYYPTLRKYTMKLKSKILQMLAKLLVFNIAIVIGYELMKGIFGMEQMLDGMEDFGKYATLVLWATANVAFFLFDICLNNLKVLYEKILKPKFKKMMR